MVAEGIHSTVDTVNQLLLLYGIKQSKKPADQSRPFGYGKDLYFWSFMVSVLIFGLGGGLSIYQGILHIVHAEPLGDPTWNYVVLGASFVFESASLLVAIKEFNTARGEVPLWKAIVGSKDPSSFLVLFEDGAAVVGLVIVFVLMQFSHAFNMPMLDGVASVLVGLLLIGVSLILARESRSLLMGEGIALASQERIIALTEQDPSVIKVLNVLSNYQSPKEVILMLMISFEPELNTKAMTDAIDRIRGVIKKEFPLIKFVIVQPG